jgi:hypothetical protein
LSKMIKIEGLDETSAAIKRMGERTHDGALEAVRRGADRIVEEARLNAPVDKGDLESAIEILSDGFRGGRRKEVIVGVNPSKLDLQSRDGFRYDIFTHEFLDTLGDESKAKASRVGGFGGIEGRVGDKYLSRAFNDVVPEIEQEVKAIQARAKL